MMDHRHLSFASGRISIHAFGSSGAIPSVVYACEYVIASPITVIAANSLSAPGISIGAWAYSCSFSGPMDIACFTFRR